MSLPKSDTNASWPTTAFSMLWGASDPKDRQWRTEWQRAYRRYWSCCYAYFRRTGSSYEDARDLVQSFWTAGLSGRFMKEYAPTRSRWRTFLKLCLDHWRTDEYRKWMKAPDRKALRFGRKKKEIMGIEERIADSQSPDPQKEFDRNWARDTINDGFALVGKRLAAAGKEVDLRILREWVMADTLPDTNEFAQELGLKRPALLKRVQRLEQQVGDEVKELLLLFLRPGESLAEAVDDLRRCLRAGRRVSAKRTAAEEMSRQMSRHGDRDADPQD